MTLNADEVQAGIAEAGSTGVAINQRLRTLLTQWLSIHSHDPNIEGDDSAARIQQMAETTWLSSQIPTSIRRPWRVYEDHLEDEFEDAVIEGSDTLTIVRDLSMVKAKGAVAAYRMLSHDLQR